MRTERATHQRKGFTLVEVVVTVAVAGVIMVLVRATFDIIVLATIDVGRISHLHDVEQNAERALRAIVAQMALPTDREPFDGRANAARFASWCRDPRGFATNCTVALEVSQHDGMSMLMMTPGGDTAIAFRRVGAMRLWYLASSDPTLDWRNEWHSTTRLPVAICVVTSSDTLVLRVGSRG